MRRLLLLLLLLPACALFDAVFWTAKVTADEGCVQLADRREACDLPRFAASGEDGVEDSEIDGCVFDDGTAMGCLLNGGRDCPAERDAWLVCLFDEDSCDGVEPCDEERVAYVSCLASFNRSCNDL